MGTVLALKSGPPRGAPSEQKKTLGQSRIIHGSTDARDSPSLSTQREARLNGFFKLRLLVRPEV